MYKLRSKIDIVLFSKLFSLPDHLPNKYSICKKIYFVIFVILYPSMSVKIFTMYALIKMKILVYTLYTIYYDSFEIF